MCGICGAVALNESFDVDEGTLVAMRDALIHRGPDDSGLVHLDGRRVALAHRRLSIVDLSAAGHQPMSNEDRTVWITYNGEIYNHRALREDLESRGHVYRSATDTETILHLYEEEGERCVEHLHGMFAFAIWDSRRQRLFLARDRLGIKPLYYARPPGGFVFGSEIKALLRHPAIVPSLDEEAFCHYLTFVSAPAPLTMFAGIRKLAPAERMTVDLDGTIESEVYWTPASSAVAREVSDMTEREMEDRLLELLRESIRKRMMSDVPFGVFLSGGVDSSTNVALMSELMDEPVRTFSVGFEGETKHNELEHARLVADHFGTDHQEVVIGWEDLESLVPQMVHHQDEPIADWVCVPLHFLSKLARETGTFVVQVGEGSDELLHGYDHYIRAAHLEERYAPALERLPRRLRQGMSRAATSATLRLGRGLNYTHFLTNVAQRRIPFWGGAICYQGELKRQVLANHRELPDSYAVVERLWREAEREFPDADVTQKMTYLELKQRLAELLLMRVDKMTMGCSVEARVPFLDHELVEFAMALPRSMKVRDGVGKYVLKRAVTGVLPAEIAYRAKQGFSAPVSDWLRGEFGVRARRQIRESSFAELGLLNYERIDELWNAHRAGRGDWAFQLWNIYNVSAWHDYWVAGRGRA